MVTEFKKNDLLWRTFAKHRTGKRGESNWLIKISRWKLKEKKNPEVPVSKGVLLFSKAIKNIVGDYKFVEIQYNKTNKLLGLKFLDEETDSSYRLANHSKYKHKICSIVFTSFAEKEYVEKDCYFDSRNRMMVIKVESSQERILTDFDFIQEKK